MNNDKLVNQWCTVVDPGGFWVVNHMLRLLWTHEIMKQMHLCKRDDLKTFAALRGSSDSIVEFQVSRIDEDWCHVVQDKNSAGATD